MKSSLWDTKKLNIVWPKKQFELLLALLDFWFQKRQEIITFPELGHLGQVSTLSFTGADTLFLLESFQAELRKDDELEELAAALDVPLSMAAPSPRYR